MQTLRYIEDAVTLTLDAEKCNGCRVCTLVCPHGVFEIGADKRAFLADRGACMECGACALNCTPGAITVTPGVGCASAIIHGWLTGTEPSCGCGEGAPSGAGDACCSSAGPDIPTAEPRDLAPGAEGGCCSGGAPCNDGGERAAPS